VFAIKTGEARDAELLLFNMAPFIRVGDYFACDMFYIFRLIIIVSYCELCRRLRLLAFVNIANYNFMLSMCWFTATLFTLVE